MSAPQPRLGLPAKYFTDKDIFEQVCNLVYFKTWQFACHSSQVPDPGDFFSFSIFDQDIFVIRGQDGNLRALYNVCQHRGHKLVEGKGNKERLICPYHAWTYDLDGKLLGAPNSRAVHGFDTSGICVPQIRLEEFLGFVFVNLDDHASPMDQSFPGVKQEILELCPGIESRSFASEHTADEGCNWLTAIENYNECYHCKVVHAEFAKGIIDPNSYSVAPFGEGKVLRHSSRATQSANAWYDVSGSDYGSYFLWPSTAIQIYPGGLVNTYHWRPLAVDDVRVHRGWYSHSGEVDNTLQKVIDLDRDTTFSEDLILVRNVQRGLRSRGYKPGPLILDPKGGIDNELSIAMLHDWLRQAVDDK
jgi:phenylpropionate dioxygenase-like ring-hydroxylating dioxygenase large terminal subunit